jgi:hypothetical protein
MKVALGLKAHSGWAALVALGNASHAVEVVDRRRLELVARGEESWAKQPYHAAENLPQPDARKMVQRGIDAARSHALRAVRDAVTRLERDGHNVDACAVLMSPPMPDWSVDEILAVHFRMHKAEGVLFRDALARAAKACERRLVEIEEKQLYDHAAKTLSAPVSTLAARLATLGKAIGPPWGKDQKEAALAAMVALASRRV